MTNWALRMILHFTVASHLYRSGGKKQKKGCFDYQIVNVLSVAHPVSCSILGHDVVVIVLVVL